MPLKIPDAVRVEVEFLARSTTAPHALVQRARIVVGCAAGRGTDFVARTVGCESRTVRKWKARFRAAPSLDTLRDLPRPGRPAQVALATRCKVVELACRRPDEKLTPFRDVWTHAALAAATQALTGVHLSVSEIGRILRSNHLRPHKIRYWLNCKDPDFAPKAERICELYTVPPPGAVVLCVDEKPVQVLGRKYPAHVGPHGEVRKEYEYIRRGTCCLLAAFEVGTGKVVAEVVAHRTADATVAFMDRIAACYPGREVYVVWDNLSTHKDGPANRWKAFNERHGKRFHFVFTPIHASWLNQVEVWFSILEKRVLKHGDFADVTAATARILGFAEHWNLHSAHPFRWTWRYNKRQDPLRKAA